MTILVDSLTLTGILTLALFLGLMNFFFWQSQRTDRTPLWLSLWLIAAALFAVCRLVQYASLSTSYYVIVPRILLTSVYILAWLGYMLGNSFIKYRPRSWEWLIVMFLALIPVVFLWSGNLILTDNVIIRNTPLGGEFHGVTVGSLYLPINLLILALGAIPAVRLVLAKTSHRYENILMAAGFLFIILFSLIDFFSTAFNLVWIRFSDFGYLPIPVFFSYIQVQRFGKLFKDMDAMVRERTIELSRTNETLRTEMADRERAQSIVQESEVRYRALMEHSAEAIFMYETDTKCITEANPAFLRLLGYSLDEVLDLTLYDVVAHEQTTVDTNIQLLLDKQVVSLGERQWRRKDGTTIDVEVTLGKISGNGKGVAFSVARNITDRKQAEQALRENEIFLRQVIDLVPHFIFAKDKNSRFLLVNDAVASAYGTTTTELVGKSDADFSATPEEARHFHKDDLAVINGGKEKFIPEEMITDAHGEVRFLQTTKIPFQFGPEKLPALMGVSVDITDRKKAEAATIQANIRYRSLFEQTHDAVFILDLQGRHLAVNQRAADMLGYSKEEILSMSVSDLSAQEQESAQVLAKLLAGEKIGIYERIFRKKDGTTFPVEINAELVRDLQGSPLHILSVARDITQRKYAEDQIQRQAVEMTALYEATHDLVMERDLSNLLHTIVERAAVMLGASSGSLFLCEPEQRQVRCVASYNTPEYTGHVLKYGEGAAGRAAETGEPLIIDDYRTWPGHASVNEVGQTFVSLLTIPMYWQGGVIGVINILDNTRAGAFTRQHLQVATLFANQAAIAIENTNLLKAELQRRQESDAIAGVGRDISASLQLEIVLEKITFHAMDLLHAESSAVYLMETKNSTLRAVAATGPDAEEIKASPLELGRGILGHIALRKTGEIVNEATSDPRAVKVEGTDDIPDEHIMGVPVMAEGQLTGLIAVWRTGKSQVFKPTDLDFLSKLAGQVAIAIGNARLYEAEKIRRQEADALREAAERITSTLDQEHAVQLILEQLAKVVPYESASLQLLRDGYLDIVGGQGWPDPPSVLGLRFPVPGDNPNSMVVLERRSVVLSHAPESYTSFKNFLHGHINSWLGVPLIVRDKVIGILAVDHSTPDFFNESHVQMVNALADQAAIAIDNTRLFGETQKRLREANGIAQVSATLSSTLELEPLLENVLQSSILAIPASECGSVVLADERENLQIRAVWGYKDPRVLGYVFPPDRGYANIAFRECRPFVVQDVHGNASFSNNGDIPELHKIKSAIVAPLVVKNRPIGVIAIESPEKKDAFTDDDLHLLTAMSASIALAIENARLFEDTQHQLSEIQAVYTVSSALRSAQTLSEALPIILDQLAEPLHASGASLELVDMETGEIVTELAQGSWARVTGQRAPAGSGISGQVIATCRPYITSDVVADGKLYAPDLIGGLHAVACVPVIAAHQPIGSLWIGRQTPIMKEEVNLLAAIGEMVGNAIQRMRLHEQTERLLADLQVANRDLSMAYDKTLEGWAKALELRDKETEGHSRRVTDLTLRLARRMGISRQSFSHIRWGVLLHDIGKMGIADQLLRKPAALTSDEWVEMRKHPQYAYDLIHPIKFLRPALDIPFCHHEKWDGSGYPRGLKGEKIPLVARIFAVVDVYDALSNDRPYRRAWPRKKVLDYLHQESGKHFDPQIVEEFLALLNKK
jgi:PAS domain S-box-containing protein